ncbi:unnamed protein product [Brachionus calyciflorus]|uniref:Transcription initiation factor IIF subunit alpha n=1 Tax=Brachionus calyciflorus TaxID=104777 RepID=A0A813M8M0_9BILA|nr:unnamed protein product [Brachionus calyciflorus]
MSIPVVQYQTYPQAAAAASAPQATEQPVVKTKEFYVKVSKSRKKFHALKFHTGAVDLKDFNKPEMSRDTSSVPTARPDWESMPKSGQGSEFNRENKELARRRKFGYVPKKVNADNLPWILTNKGNEKEKTKDKQYIGKKSISENSCYFVFIKCDGGFEAHPLEDWYSFAPHKTYKTLDIDEAEEEFKRRHKILNKHLIMAYKRKADGEGEGEEEEEAEEVKAKGKAKGKEVKKGAKSFNLSDDEDDFVKRKVNAKRKPKKRGDDDDDGPKDMEDSDDGDHEGREKDYSDTGSENEEPEPDTAKYDEKYEEKGIDEEEAIRVMEKSSDEEEEEEDEDLTEEGKEYKKLMSKKDEDEDEFDEFVKTGKISKEDQEETKDSSSSFDEMDLDEDKSKKSKSSDGGKLKRKATDPLQKTAKKLQKTASGNLQTHDESSSSSTTSTAQTSKASKTAAILAAVQAKSGSSSQAAAPSPVQKTEGLVLNDETVKRYLARKPMTTKELLHKFRGKTQDKMTNEELCQKLKTILDKLGVIIFEKNGVKYLSLP